MRRPVHIALRGGRQLAAAALCVAGTVALATAASAAAPPSQPKVNPRTHVELRDLTCHTALDPLGRSVTVTAVMRPLSAPERLALRATLQRRGDHGRFRNLRGGRLGQWITPMDVTLGRRARDTWIVNLPVHDLLAPATYRFLVTFRWSDMHGRTVAQTQLRSGLCMQPELRPDLVVLRPVRITAASGAGPGAQHYLVRVRNRGRTATGPFDVVLTDAGQPYTQSVTDLAPATTTSLRFTAPACNATAPPRVAVDPQGRVDDYNPANNTLTVACPPSS